MCRKLIRDRFRDQLDQQLVCSVHILSQMEESLLLLAMHYANYGREIRTGRIFQKHAASIVERDDYRWRTARVACAARSARSANFANFARSEQTLKDLTVERNALLV